RSREGRRKWRMGLRSGSPRYPITPECSLRALRAQVPLEAIVRRARRELLLLLEVAPRLDAFIALQVAGRETAQGARILRVDGVGALEQRDRCVQEVIGARGVEGAHGVL